MRHTEQSSFDKKLATAMARMKGMAMPFSELFYGIKTRTLPWELCTGVFVVVCVLITCRVDVWAFRKAHLTVIYPRKPYLYWPYVLVASGSGFLMWAGAQAGRRRRLAKQLAEAFQCAGLKNRMGKVPNFIYDRPLDAHTRKLKVTTAKLSLSEFKKAKDSVESGLQVYVDEIREDRGRGTIEITYSHLPMPNMIELEDVNNVGAMGFMVGHTRASIVAANYEAVPHLLVAGQTNSGKSTFLRQLIVSAYLNNEHFQFSLIDLKAGLEFQMFENLPRIRVVPDLAQASAVLNKLKEVLDRRMQLLKLNKVKDLSAYLKIREGDRKMIRGVGKSPALHRHLIVIDEAADLFLAGGGVLPSEIQAARRNLVELARKGRAVGLHLIFATQRPDTRSIDSQVKANLPGILCFQMPNHASSMTVLGNGRATDLPPIPGRAIWKCGSDMIEVQTPYLSPERTDELLKNFRTNERKSDAADAPDELPTAPVHSSSSSDRGHVYVKIDS